MYGNLEDEEPYFGNDSGQTLMTIGKMKQYM